MNPQIKPQLATERMQNDFTLFNELTKRLGALRTDGSPAKVKESGIDALVLKHTGIKIKFGINPSKMVNAYMMPPQLDVNHPFYTTMGMAWLPEPGQQKTLGVNPGSKKQVEVWTNDANYTVGGAWSKVEIQLEILKGMMKHKSFTDGQIAAIFLHELGHAYTYLSLFGKLSRKNWLTSEAVKDILGAPDLEKRVQVLTRLEGELDISIKNKEKVSQEPEKIRGKVLESIIITEVACNLGTTSANKNFDTRNIEQIADQFAIYHGAGADLATGMLELYRGFGVMEAKSTITYVIFEVIKIMFFGVLTSGNPILAVLILLIAIPSNKVYDDPEARVELIRKQTIESLKHYKDQPEMHKKLMEQLEVMEGLKGLLKDRRSLYTLIYQTISPRGRSMYRQEVFMKSVENLLYNDTYFNAAKFGALTNEN